MNDSMVVYGTFNDFEICFLKIEDAQRYANFHNAHNSGITFEKLFDSQRDFFIKIIDYYCYFHYGFYTSTCENKFSCGQFYSDLFKRLYSEFKCDQKQIGMHNINVRIDSFIEFTDYYQKRIPFEDRVPVAKDNFCHNTIDFFMLMEIINFEPRMEWVPETILQRVGYKYESVLDGSFTCFLIEREAEVLSAFQEYGFKCERNDKLIAQAYGE